MPTLAEEAAAAVGLAPPREPTPTVPSAGLSPATASSAPEGQVVVVPGFLPPIDCARLIGHFEANIGAHAAAMERDGDTFFSGRVMWATSFRPDSPAVRILRSAQLRAEAVISRALNRPMYSDNIQVVRWPEGVAMPPHQDDRHPNSAEPHGTPWRAYAGVLYLNADYGDGEIYFPGIRQAYKPDAPGAFVFFPGPLWHGTRSPVGGPRYTSPQWFTSDLSKRDPGLPPPV